MSAPRPPAESLDLPSAGHMGDGLRLETPEQVAERCAVPVTWVRSEARAGRLPSLKLGHYRRFVPADVDAWLEQLREGRG